jgi:hypothetical protein
MNATTIVRGEGQEPLGVLIPGFRWQKAVEQAARHHHKRPQNLSFWEVLVFLKLK